MLDLDLKEGLTFDDVLLIPAYSEAVASDVDTRTRLTRNIELAVPLVSAAMDTVTEARAAIVMAQQGGLGFIHKNLSPEAQAAEVKKVKKFESGMIVDPISVDPDQKLIEAMKIMRSRGISGVPVTKGGKLIGLLTNRDIRFEKNLDLKVKSLMTPRAKLHTVSEGITLPESKELLHKYKIEKLPVVDKKGKLIGLITLKDIEKTEKHPFAVKDEYGRLRVGAAVGVGPAELKRCGLLLEAGADVICVDTAHGHSRGVIQQVKAIRREHPQAELIAGNVGTADGALALIEAGVDAVKVGIGPGSICTTRIVAGVGVPQITAVAACAKAAEQHRVPVIADGGVKYSGDVTKAIAAGASSVMIGSMFAGTDESPGEMILYQGRSYKVYRGMGSLGAMRDGSAMRYGQAVCVEDILAEAGEPNGLALGKLVPEGIEGRVPYRGPLSAVIYQLVGGLKSGMGYTGCRSIAELRLKARFMRISLQAMRESHVHDVIITKEAPNYRME
ncbi:MAG TPA: IMP dehydrogenase [bacterium]|nr:IMP dehydrogenase [bacterium]